MTILVDIPAQTYTSYFVFYFNDSNIGVEVKNRTKKIHVYIDNKEMFIVDESQNGSSGVVSLYPV